MSRGLEAAGTVPHFPNYPVLMLQFVPKTLLYANEFYGALTRRNIKNHLLWRTRFLRLRITYEPSEPSKAFPEATNFLNSKAYFSPAHQAISNPCLISRKPYVSLNNPCLIPIRTWPYNAGRKEASGTR